MSDWWICLSERLMAIDGVWPGIAASTRAACRQPSRSDPAADRHDQPGLLGDRDELVGRHHPALGVVPAQQRLDAGDRAVVQPHDGLVVELELPGGDRALQVGPQLQAGEHALVHLRARTAGSRPCRRAWRCTSRRRRRGSSRRRRRRRPGRARRCRGCSAARSPCGRPAAAWRERLEDAARRCRPPPGCSATSSSSTANSSPPKRAAVSAPRMLASSRRATSISTSSPAAWPRLSLIVLEVVEVEEEHRAAVLLAARARDRVAHALGEQRAVGEAGDARRGRPGG